MEGNHSPLLNRTLVIFRHKLLSPTLHHTHKALWPTLQHTMLRVGKYEEESGGRGTEACWRRRRRRGKRRVEEEDGGRRGRRRRQHTPWMSLQHGAKEGGGEADV